MLAAFAIKKHRTYGPMLQLKPECVSNFLNVPTCQIV